MTGEESAQQSRATGLLAQIKRSWARDQELSLARRIEKGLRFAMQLLRARAALKDCDRVGASARVAGRMRVSNRGSIVIGDCGSPSRHGPYSRAWLPCLRPCGKGGHRDR